METAALLYAKAGDRDKTELLADSLLALHDRDMRSFSESRRDRWQEAEHALNVAEARALLGDAEAIASMDDLLEVIRQSDWIDYAAHEKTAAAYASIQGDDAAALRHLERCLRDTKSYCSSASLRVDPWWAYLRGDPRFEAMLVRYDR